MAITVAQARRAKESLEDVFIPNGDAGTLLALSLARAEGHVRVEGTATRESSDAWYPLGDLDTAETLKDKEGWKAPPGHWQEGGYYTNER